MVPKIIHYCWFGKSEMPELAMKCMKTWAEKCPDYTIMRWDETNADINENSYIKEAYDAGKWAFVSDYFRLKALYQFGGIYLDTDVEVIKTFDSFLGSGSFLGFETQSAISTGIMGFEKMSPMIKDLLEAYNERHFLLPDGTFDLTTNVSFITRYIVSRGISLDGKMQSIAGINIYPQDYFSPKSYDTGLLSVTDNTVCIHHFDGSWHSEKEVKLHKKQQYFQRKYGKFGIHLFRIYKVINDPGILKKIIFK